MQLLKVNPGLRNRRRRGNVMVEAVFTFLPMFAMILFFTDIGMMLFRWTTLQNAVREGCRYAITFQTSPGKGQDASVSEVVQRYAFGLVKTTDTPQRIHVDYFSPASPNASIASGGNVPGNVVEVSVQGLNLAWMFPLSGTLAGPFYASVPLQLTVRSSDILGGYPAGTASIAR
ncbi:MAG: TadE/TadG family type IV pilus assembly protein [Bryobacteraceae bacterium]